MVGCEIGLAKIHEAVVEQDWSRGDGVWGAGREEVFSSLTEKTESNRSLCSVSILLNGVFDYSPWVGCEKYGL